ncbi:MAG TPA: MFS transporter, partial [Candidatus Berkiella sp.]|nr:MFS transporter [Candidatus Berkiella sp.]
MGTSMAVTGYRIAMLVSGGLTMIIAHYSSFSFTYLLMAALMGVGVFATLWGQEPQHYREKSVPFLTACLEPFKEFFSRQNAIALLGFMVL